MTAFIPRGTSRKDLEQSFINCKQNAARYLRVVDALKGILREVLEGDNMDGSFDLDDALVEKMKKVVNRTAQGIDVMLNTKEET